MQVHRLDSVQLQQARDTCFCLRSPVQPKCAPQARPGRCEANLVGIRVLDDEPIQSLRMAIHNTEPDGPAVILNKQTIVIKTLQLQEMFNDFGDHFEGVGVCSWIWHVAISKTRIVWSDDMEPVCQGGYQVAVLVRGRRESMEQ